MEKLRKDLKNYQLNGDKTYVNYQQDKYSSYQNHLYKRALYGMNAFTQEEISQMCSKKKHRINNVYSRAQLILNKFKQELTIQYTNLLFQKFFPKSPITEFLLADTETDEKFKNTLNFKDLGIDKDQIITIFMNEGILPKNFLSLNEHKTERM
jgi:hypothetical protein